MAENGGDGLSLPAVVPNFTRMLSDRSYMRDGRGRQSTSVLTWLILVIVGGFVLQNVFQRWFASSAFDRLFALSVFGLKSGRIWQLFTYGFLHDTGNILHILGNVLGLYFLGRELLPLMGARRFLGLYSGSVIAGGLVWAATNWRFGGAVIGCSAAVCAFLIVFACFYPNERLTFLLFFIFPVTLKPKYVAAAVAIFDLGGFLFYELPGNPSPLGLAHSAHLGGMLAGLVYYRYLHETNWKFFRSRPDIELPRWLRKSKKTAAPAPAYRVNIASRDDLRAEVDRILDKINSAGFGALTAEEKHLLDEAKDLLSRH